jgi:hypothetical protein
VTGSIPFRQSGRRTLGAIDGVEMEAGVELLSDSVVGEPAVLVVTVIDGMVKSPVSRPDLALSQGYIDPVEMAALLVEHGYARGISEGDGER